MYRILLHSSLGDGYGLAQQMSLEGHMVTVYCEDEFERKCYEGLIHKTDDWEGEALKSDFVIFDDNGFGDRAEKLRARGVKVWGGGRLADKLESDRSFGMEVMAKAGIPVPNVYQFKSGEEARAIVEKEFKDKDRAVIKLDDTHASKATSYVSSDKADMLTRIENWMTTESDSVNLSGGGIIQEFIKGVEMSINGWFDGENFLYPYSAQMEDKKLLDGDGGPNTGCAQNIIKNLRPEHPKLAKMLLEPLIPMLRKGGFVGELDVNCIVDSDGKPYCLEFTPRMGYDSTSTWVVGLAGYGEAVARALSLKTCNDVEGCECPEGCRCLVCGSPRPAFWFLGGVRTYLPPYPFEAVDHEVTEAAYQSIKGVEIKGWLDGSDKTKERIILCDAVMEKGKLLVGGTCGIPFIALGHGPTMEVMVEDVYKHLGEVKVANLCYRSDLGVKAKRNWTKIEHLLR